MIDVDYVISNQTRFNFMGGSAVAVMSEQAAIDVILIG